MQAIDLMQRINTFVTEKIAPGVVAHGGQVEVVEFQEGKLTLGLSGSCSTCSMDAMTKEGIAEFMLNEFPELDDCVVVDLPEEPVGFPGVT